MFASFVWDQTLPSSDCIGATLAWHYYNRNTINFTLFLKVSTMFRYAAFVLHRSAISFAYYSECHVRLRASLHIPPPPENSPLNVDCFSSIEKNSPFSVDVFSSTEIVFLDFSLKSLGKHREKRLSFFFFCDALRYDSIMRSRLCYVWFLVSQGRVGFSIQRN